MNIVIIVNGELCDDYRFGGMYANTLEIFQHVISLGGIVYSASSDIISVDGVVRLDESVLEQIRALDNYVVIVLQERPTATIQPTTIDYLTKEGRTESIEYKLLFQNLQNTVFFYNCPTNPRPSLLRSYRSDLVIKHDNMQHNIDTILSNYKGRFFSTIHDSVPDHVKGFLGYLFNKELHGAIDRYTGLYLQR